MAQYEIRFLPSVRKDLRKLETSVVKRILQRIDCLVDNPRPPDCKKLTGRGLYRVRTGVYRIVYEVRDRDVVVVVVKVGHRSDVYL